MAENQDNGRKSGNNSKTKAANMPGLQPHNPIHDMLGQKLKAYYAEITSEPIPDRLTALLAKLEAQSAAGDSLDDGADGKDR
jgi:Anti-sigma factor NepR